jgi:hypothetical protein
LGVLAEPFPSFASLNVSYNATEFVRVFAGAGTLTFLGESLGGGVKYIFSPERPVSFVAGLGLSRSSLNGLLDSIFGGDVTSPQVIWSQTLSGGIDWQTESGFNLGLGLNWMYLSTSSEAVGTRVLPYLTLGWFF